MEMEKIATKLHKNYTLRTLIKEASSFLEQANIESPQINCEILLTDILGIKNRMDLYLSETKLSPRGKILFNKRLNMRFRRYPVQHITQKAHFMDFELIITPFVFIPRPETEILVEKVLEIIQTHLLNKKILDFRTYRPSLKILDVGTGSGNIAIALAKYIPQAKITAIDISDKILKIAKRNAKLNRVEKRIRFTKMDILKLFDKCCEKFDIVVSNPPYIPTYKLHLLQPEVKLEPQIALDGGYDGLRFHKIIINNIKKILNPEGFLVLEIGESQSDKIKELLENSRLKLVEITRDYSKIDRVIICQLHSLDLR